ncbi:transposase [Methylobacterium sp. 1030]|uniref:transposase n=1 Tax=Methylobacterium sp. 1030 TaxID=3156404 RepID=UPI00339206E0
MQGRRAARLPSHPRLAARDRHSPPAHRRRLRGRGLITRHSGSSLRIAAIAGGRKPLRDVLFMAALTASRHNPTFRAVYDRLRSYGKPHKLALIAVLTKRVTALNAMIQSKNHSRPLDHRHGRLLRCARKDSGGDTRGDRPKNRT